MRHAGIEGLTRHVSIDDGVGGAPETERTVLSAARWRAVIFDLDGVITRTARVHARAWKQAFDEFLTSRPQAPGEDHTLFDDDIDYRRHVDGKPRYDGVAAFLEARGIRLPWGEPDDPPGHDTICALGNRKNEVFRESLDRDGVEVYAGAVDLLERVREVGMATAVVSSSRNAAAVVDAAGLARSFDERVDGTEAHRLGLEGKPAPDIFLAACDRLGLEPEECVVVEDAVAGVQAGARGGFGLVMGVDRDDHSERLEAAGAHVVVRDLGEIDVLDAEAEEEEVEDDRPEGALDAFDAILERLGDRPLIFLDFDGTLTPIVEHPDDAVLDDDMRATLDRLVRLRPVAVISGRDREDVRARVGIDGIHYAGSHGLDIAGPRFEAQRGSEFVPDLDAARSELEERLADVEGVHFEPKRASVAVHYRQVPDTEVARVRREVERVVSHYENRLRVARGKKVLELRPDIDWDKGRALCWLQSNLASDDALEPPALYIGDDVTDEDAFEAVHDRGVGIRVGQPADGTKAHHLLRDPAEVREFLDRLAAALGSAREGAAHE